MDADRDQDARRDDRDTLEDEAWDAGDEDELWDPDEAAWDPEGDGRDPDDGPGDPGDDGWDSGNDRAYWRRRFFILCAGVAALGVCAWLFPGAHQPGKPGPAAGRAASALAQGPAMPPAAYGKAYPQSAPSPSAPADPYPTAGSGKTAKKLKKQKVSTAYQPNPVSSATTAKAKAKPRPKAKAKDRAKTTGAAGPAKCAPGNIVLSLLTSQSGYAKGVRPQFSVYAVSTASAPCTLPYGAGSVQIVVTRQGRVVWDSTSCRPSPAKAVRFTRGVPQVVTMTWNPKAAKPAGCSGALPAGATGTLDAVALSHGQTSPVHAFKIRGLSPEGGLQGVAHVLDLGDLDR